MKDRRILKKNAAALLIITEFAGCVILAGNLSDANNRILSLNGQINEITQLNTELSAQKEVLQEKISILSYTINTKVQREKDQEEEIRQSYIPTGLPFKGTAFYNDQEKEFDGNPIATFYNAEGISVIASANGTVSSIEGDPQNGFTVTVDHGNGYCSIYRSGLQPNVSEGDAVTDKTVLFPVNAQNQKLVYQITSDGTYIDPIELIESYG